MGHPPNPILFTKAQRRVLARDSRREFSVVADRGSERAGMAGRTTFDIARGMSAGRDELVDDVVIDLGVDPPELIVGGESFPVTVEPRTRLDRFTVRTFDVAVALIGIVVLAVPMVVIALAVKLSGRGPVFFRAARHTIDGREFQIVKFRTMVVGGDDVIEQHFREHPHRLLEFEAFHKLEEDPRVTGIGRVLRKTSLDEVPQFFSVLRGHMSVVGPRPMTDDELARFGPSLPLLQRVKSGITGPWQVSGRSTIDFPTRMAIDLDYTTQRTLRRDAVIVLRTLGAVWRRDGAH